MKRILSISDISNNIYYKQNPEYFLILKNLVENHKFVDKNTGKWIYPYDRSQDDLYETKHQFILANNVIIIYTNGYTKYLDYINAVYGKDYISQFKNSTTKNG